MNVIGNSAEIDACALASLENKLEFVEDHVEGVAIGIKKAFFLYGSGGVGKSFTVLSKLKTLQARYRLHNSHMTAKGLFSSLRHMPDRIHVFEDMESMMRDAKALGVLRSAAWAQPGHDRVVRWASARAGEQQFVFRGGLILISNRPLADLPEVKALVTRIETYHLQATEGELAALMRSLACEGYQREDKIVIAADECKMVTEHLLTECRDADCPLDLRLQQKSFQNYLQWDVNRTHHHWKQLVAISVREAAHHFRYPSNKLPPETRKREHRNMIRKIISETNDEKEQKRLYEEQSGMSRADFYRRKGEVLSREFDEEVPG